MAASPRCIIVESYGVMDENLRAYILGLSCLRLRGPNGAKDEFHLAATAQNLHKLAKLVATRPKMA